jgi:quercetin dioxygenase-like cupin family protein
MVNSIYPSSGGEDMKSILFKGGLEVHFSEEGKENHHARSVFRCVVPPGARTPMPHYHERFEESVTGVKGTTTWVVNGERNDLGPGDSLLIPRGATHYFANHTKEPVEFSCLITPGILESEYFEDVASVVNVEGLPDFDKLQGVMRQHGLVPVLGVRQKIVFAMLGLIRKFKSLQPVGWQA